MKFWNMAAGMFLAAIFLSGCATEQLGKVYPAGAMGSTEIDGVKGTFTQFDNRGKQLSLSTFDPESIVKINSIVYGETKPRLFEWQPILGVDVCDGEGSFFCGARYLEIQRFGLHFGGDRNHFVPFGICYEKMGIIAGVQIEQNWLDLLEGKLKQFGVGLMMTLKL